MKLTYDFVPPPPPADRQVTVTITATQSELGELAEYLWSQHSPNAPAKALPQAWHTLHWGLHDAARKAAW